MIDANGEQLGIVPGKDAQQMAIDQNLDLVKIAPQAKPPVCRIMDYGKFKYEQSKKEKESRKNQKVTTVKEIRLSPNIEEHDMQVKASQAIKFLTHGDKVKVTLRFRGRQMSNIGLGQRVMEKFREMLSEAGAVEKAAKMEGRQLIMFIAPKAEK